MLCTYTTEDDGRGTAPKSYVRLLQARVNVLEQILRMHNIDIDASAAQLLEQNEMPATTITSSVDAAGAGANADNSSTAFDQLCIAFEGTLALGEPLNFEGDGEARYFGSTSGRLDFPEHHGRSVSGSASRSPVRSFSDRTCKVRSPDLSICPHLPPSPSDAK